MSVRVNGVRMRFDGALARANRISLKYLGGMREQKSGFLILAGVSVVPENVSAASRRSDASVAEMTGQWRCVTLAAVGGRLVWLDAPLVAY